MGQIRPSAADKRRTFRLLHESGCFVIPNPWDAGSARLLAGLGFEALATTSAGLAFALARPDGAGRVSREETLANARAIVEATELPVSADLERGFGDAPEAAAETIRQAIGVGLVGGSIEDSTGRKDQPIYDIGFAAERIRAAAEVAHAQPFPFLLTGRAENHLHGRADLADTIRRLQAYQEAGADVLYAPGLRSLADIASLVRSVDRPVNVLAGAPGPLPQLGERVDARGLERVGPPVPAHPLRARHGEAGVPARGRVGVEGRGAGAGPFPDSYAVIHIPSWRRKRQRCVTE